MGSRAPRQHALLVVPGGVAEPQPQQEAVELRFGQRERALELDRVLGGEHEERLRERARLAVDGDRALLHRLEQRRLRARGGAVDLVGEHDRGDQWPLAELELAGLLRVEMHAEDVRGHQVGCALDAVEVRADGARERARCQRLAGARHVLQQHVSAGEQGDEQELDGLLGADDDARDVLADRLGGFGEGADGLGPVGGPRGVGGGGVLNQGGPPVTSSVGCKRGA